MSLEAARDCLSRFSVPPKVAGVILASTTSPFADRLGASVVCGALGLPEDTPAIDLCGSGRAGTSALLQAIRTAQRTGEHILGVCGEQVLARTASMEEALCGDAAAAFMVGRDDLIAEFLGGHSVTADFVDHFRGRGHDFNYNWEPRWVRDEGILGMVPDAVRAALRDAQLTAAEVDRFVFPSLIQGAAAAVTRDLGIAPEAVTTALDDAVGNCAGAAPLLELSSALETADPGEVLVVVGFGSGVDVIVLRRTELTGIGPRTGVSGWLRRRLPSNNYVKFMAARGLIELEGGIRSEFDQKQSMSALWRNRRALASLQGAVDRSADTVVFPPRPGGDEDEIEFHRLADDVARIVTFTADRLAYSPDPPTCYGVIDFPSGARMSAEFCDVLPDALHIDMKVRMMLRVKALDKQRGFRSYFWKATPDYLAAGEAG
jgi:3-hydroxy-3-methylglutaryl CoA synthase